MERETITRFLASPHSPGNFEFIVRINEASAKVIGAPPARDTTVEKISALINTGVYKEWGGAMAKLMGIYIGKDVPIGNVKEVVPGSWPWENTFMSTFRVLIANKDYAPGAIVMQIDKDRCVTSEGTLLDHAILAPGYMALATPLETEAFFDSLVSHEMLGKLKDYVRSHPF